MAIDSDITDNDDHAQMASGGSFAQMAASGYHAQMAASGDHARTTARGDYARMAASGNGTKMVAEGRGTVIASAGPFAYVKGKNGTWIALAEFVDGECVGFATGCIGKDGLKEDVFYEALDGKLVEAS